MEGFIDSDGDFDLFSGLFVGEHEVIEVVVAEVAVFDVLQYGHDVLLFVEVLLGGGAFEGVVVQQSLQEGQVSLFILLDLSLGAEDGRLVHQDLEVDVD